MDVDQSLKLGRPEVRVIPDREKAAALGIDADQLATTVQAMIGGMDVGTFSESGNRYDIRVRLEEQDRRDPDSILGLYVRTRQGGTMELRNLVRVEKGAAPSTITRVNRQRAVRISANLDGREGSRHGGRGGPGAREGDAARRACACCRPAAPRSS